MADKSVEERVGTLEQDAEHTKSSLTKIEGLFTSLHNDIHNTQAQSNSNFNAVRVELKQDVERHRNETAANFAKSDSNLSDFKKETSANFEKLETRLKESIGESDSNLSDFKKETAANFAKSDSNLSDFKKETAANFARLEKMVGDLSKDLREYQTAMSATQSQFNVELVRQKTNTRWIIVFGLGLVGAAFADSVGWLSLIGKLLSGG